MGLRESIEPFVTLAAGSRGAGSGNGTSNDLWDATSGRARAVCYVLNAPAGNTGTLDVVIEESDDNTTFTTIPNSRISEGSQFTQVTTAASTQERTVQPSGRYTRCRYTVGTGPQVFAVIGVAGQPLDEPI